jgi:uncharacterized damage-inducible protein DinB
MSTNDAAIVSGSTGALQRVLANAHRKIEHCMNQLSDDQLNWRPFELQNSIANVVLHLCGNMTQWIIAGIEQRPDTRRRQAEFDDRKRYTRAELTERLAAVVREADETLSRITPTTITQPRRVQAHDVSVIDAIVDSVSHFIGHSHEIVYITRLQLRETYKFMFVPTREQGGV